MTPRPWETIGRGVVLVVAFVVALAISSIIELYWPDVYEFVVEGSIGVALVWLIFWRDR